MMTQNLITTHLLVAMNYLTRTFSLSTIECFITTDCSVVKDCATMTHFPMMIHNLTTPDWSMTKDCLIATCYLTKKYSLDLTH